MSNEDIKEYHSLGKKFLVVTTMNNKLKEEYGHQFLETYKKFWPFELKIYNEDEDMYEQIPDLKKFVDRNGHRFGDQDKVKKYWKDGVRFSYKVYAYTHAILNTKDYTGIIGIDADSVFYKPINTTWIHHNIHRDDCMMAYLGRGDKHYSECGFLYFNLGHPYTKSFALEMKKMYDEDKIYEEEQQHDSYIWDVVRKRFEEDSKVKNHDLGDGRGGHVQARSVLGTIYDHLKGPKRKQKGKSPEFRGEK